MGSIMLEGLSAVFSTLALNSSQLRSIYKKGLLGSMRWTEGTDNIIQLNSQKVLRNTYTEFRVHWSLETIPIGSKANVQKHQTYSCTTTQFPQDPAEMEYQHIPVHNDAKRTHTCAE